MKSLILWFGVLFIIGVPSWRVLNKFTGNNPGVPVFQQAPVAVEYSPTSTVTCAPGEWSLPYTLTSNNISWETSEDAYQVRVNQDPRAVYGTDNGGKLGIPSEPRVRIVEFMSRNGKPMTVTIRKK